MKKKILSLMLAMVMMLSLSVTALANSEITNPSNATDGYVDEVSVSVTKAISGSSIGTAETFNFVVEAIKVTDAKDSVTVVNMPKIGTYNEATGNYEFNINVAADATSEDTDLTLPSYNDAGVGVYYYSIKETAGSTLGVDYDEDVYILKVTVLSITTTSVDESTQEETATTELKRVVSIWKAVLDDEGNIQYNDDGSIKVESTKVDTDGSGDSDFGFTNTYTANKLTVTKTISGNLADPTQAFTFTVSFENKTDSDWTNAITTSGNVTQAVDEDGNPIANTYTFSIIGGASATFDNLPSGLTYTVTEDDYSGDGYTTTIGNAETSEANGEMAGEDVTVTVNNDKDPGADTGISLDSLPYILMLIVVAAGVVVMISRRRLDNRF